MNSFLRDLISVFRSRLFVITSGVLTSILTARYISPEGNGLLAILIAYPDIIITLGALGISHAITYLIGKEIYKLEDIVSSIFAILILSVSICITICFFLLNFFVKASIDTNLIIIAIFMIPFMLFNNYSAGIFLGTKSIKDFNKINWIPDVLKLFGILVLVVLLNRDVYGGIMSVLFGHIVLTIFIFNKLNGKNLLVINFNFNIVREIIKLGLLYAISLFIINLNYKIGTILLGWFSNEYEVGIYSKGVSVVQYLWEIPTLLSTLIFSRSANAKDPDKFSQNVCHLLRLCSIIILLIGAIFFFLSEYIMVYIYGENFRSSAIIQKILIPGVWLLTVFKVLNMDLVGKGKPLIAMKAIGPALVINITINILITSNFGGIGAAIASTLSYCIGAALFLHHYSVAVKIPIKEIIFFKKDDFIILKYFQSNGKSIF